MTLLHRDQAGIRLRAVAWSPDGTRTASASSNGVVPNPAGLVQVWEAATGTTILSYRGHPYGAVDVAWSPDGQRLASAGGPDGTAQVWEAESGGLLVTYQDSKRAAALAARMQQQGPRGALVGVGLPYDGMIPAALAGQWVPSLGWLSGGERIVSVRSNQAHVWEATTGRHLFTYGSHRSQIVALAVSSDGARAATLTGWLVQVWETVEKAKGLFIYRGHANDGSNVESLAWSPDGTRLASGSWDKTVQVWDARSGERLFTYQEHTAAVTDVAWSPDGSRIASTDLEGTIHVWPIG